MVPGMNSKFIGISDVPPTTTLSILRYGNLGCSTSNDSRRSVNNLSQAPYVLGMIRRSLMRHSLVPLGQPTLATFRVGHLVHELSFRRVANQGVKDLNRGGATKGLAVEGVFSHKFRIGSKGRKENGKGKAKAIPKKVSK
ncbi:hypothetical protein DVH24_007910 [Malus domestica]|uniref:Uncharacterized protein n=1 Tax=Malus domestica TaxID=3750 RepID=A0A498JIN4_MALDO|nr:hypothetical protein DVH24_007910 [Malus domestica]